MTDVSRCVEQLRKDFDILAEIDCNPFLGENLDLYTEIKKHHRNNFEHNQRLLFVLTCDAYEHSNCGVLLQSIQTILNEVDISNFFVCIVTTNNNVQKEYNWVLDNISVDKVPCNIYKCKGAWTGKPAMGRFKAFSKHLVYSTAVDDLQSLNSNEKEKLLSRGSFCLMPWAGMMLNPSEDVRPCSAFSANLGNLNHGKLKDLWNNDDWQELRQKMLRGEKVSGCDACYSLEAAGKQSMRLSANRKFSKLITKIDLDDTSNGRADFNLLYWGIRHNNLCNLVCRGCNPGLSSSWFLPASKLGFTTPSNSFIGILKFNNITDQLLEHVHSVETVYLGGGEPLIIDECYQILDFLDAHGRNDVHLIYSTNLTKLSLRNKSIIDYWKKFNRVTVGASLDGELERGEYLRQNTVWRDIVANRQTLMTECPHIDFYVSATVSLLNVLHLPDFHRSWVEKGLITTNDFNLQLLLDPGYLRIDSAPLELKEQILEKYKDYLSWLAPRDTIGRATEGALSVINHIQNQRDFNAAEFWNYTTKLDQYFGTDLVSVFPELYMLSKDRYEI